MNDVMVTVAGYAGTDPEQHVSKDVTKDLEWVTFRVASTRRVLSETHGWADGPTLWFTVKLWRTAAQNVLRSVRKGNPVVVTGRLGLDEWTGSDGQQRANLVVHASAVGVDATRGKVDYARLVHHDTVAEEQGTDAASGRAGGLSLVPQGEPDPFAVDRPELVNA